MADLPTMNLVTREDAAWMLEASVTPESGFYAWANRKLQSSAPALAHTVIALHDQLAELEATLAAERGDPRGAEGLHPGWVHRAAGWCLVDGVAPIATVRRHRPVSGGECYLAWSRGSTVRRWHEVPAGLTIREAMRFVETQVLP